MIDRKIRMGMVGGGKGAFIGSVHRMAANLDGLIELVCGAFSSDEIKSKEFGKELFLQPQRSYANYEEMILAEKNLPKDKRMDLISIVTPNHMHFDPAKLALENGFHVMCDKPVTFDLEEALILEKLAAENNLIFGVTHTYTGYPMVKQARDMVNEGKLGKIRKVVVEYPQGWLSDKIENNGNKQADWRTDPKKSGISCCMGDIGTHAANLAEFITGLKIESLCADLTTFVDGRLLEDDGNVLIRFNNGAKGILYASQISIGEENPLKIRVYGEKSSIEWQQMEPNTLIVKYFDQPTQLYRTGSGHSVLSKGANMHTRVPAGHPEGYIEAFANLYRNLAICIDAQNSGKNIENEYRDFPTIKDGIRGMKFIERVVESSNSDQKWVKF